MSKQNYDTLAMSIMSMLLHDPRNFREGRLCEAMFPKPLDCVFNIAVSLYREGVRPTPEAIGCFKHKDAGEASKIAAQIMGRNPPIVPFDRLVQTAAIFLSKQRMAAVCRKYHDLVHHDDVDFENCLSEFQGEAIAIKVNSDAGSLRSGSEFSTINERIQWQQRNIGKLRGPTTGYAQMDRYLNGLTPRYYIVGARPSVGKTAELCDLNTSICSEGGMSAIFSLEMPADDLRERCLSSWSRVSLSGFRDTPYTISELEAVTKAQNDIQNWRWFINDNADTSIADIESQCIGLYREAGKIDMVAIDYLQLIKTKSSRDRRQEVDEISGRLKRLGRNVNTAMIALSQLSRQEGIFKKELGRTVERRPEMSWLKESGGLEADADVIQFIHRDIRNEPEKAEFIIAKQRGGQTCDSIPMIYNGALTTFKDA